MLKLLHLNIERDKHYDRWVPFLHSYGPDVVALQEVLEVDVPLVQEKMNLKHVAYAPMWLHPADGKERVVGILLGSNLPLEHVGETVYYGPGNGREFVDPLKQAEPGAPVRFVLLSATITKNGQPYRIATTHYPWTPNGEANDVQKVAIVTLLEKLETFPKLILTGDFNAPRGKEIFTKLAAAYHDNVPPHHINSLDKSLHRAGQRLPDYMVDGLFTTPDYVASEVNLHAGLSDHMAITATIKPTA